MQLEPSAFGNFSIGSTTKFETQVSENLLYRIKYASMPGTYSFDTWAPCMFPCDGKVTEFIRAKQNLYKPNGCQNEHCGL